MAGLEGPLLVRFAPEDLVVAVGVEGGIEVGEVHGGVGEVFEFLEVVAAASGRWAGMPTALFKWQ